MSGMMTATASVVMNALSIGVMKGILFKKIYFFMLFLLTISLFVIANKTKKMT